MIARAPWISARRTGGSVGVGAGAMTEEIQLILALVSGQTWLGQILSQHETRHQGLNSKNACVVAGVESDKISGGGERGRHRCWGGLWHQCWGGLWHRTDGDCALPGTKYFPPRSWQIAECYFLQGFGEKDSLVSAEINNVYFLVAAKVKHVVQYLTDSTFSVEIIGNEQISSWSLKYKETHQIRSRNSTLHIYNSHISILECFMSSLFSQLSWILFLNLCQTKVTVEPHHRVMFLLAMTRPGRALLTWRYSTWHPETARAISAREDWSKHFPETSVSVWTECCPHQGATIHTPLSVFKLNSLVYLFYVCPMFSSQDDVWWQSDV